MVRFDKTLLEIDGDPGSFSVLQILVLLAYSAQGEAPGRPRTKLEG